MIPMCLVTGFLGSGKTTFLKRVIEKHRDRKMVYLVNEFSPRDVDGRRLLQDEADVVSVPGGSIFCHCMVEGFVDQLKEIPERFDSAEARIEGLVVEASGISDPRVVRKMLAETEMDRVYKLCQIIAVVDPRSYLRLIHTLPNVQAQVESADHVIVNKIDACSDEDLKRALKIIRQRNPAAVIDETKYCACDVDPFRVAPERELGGELAPSADPHFDRIVVRLSGPIDPKALSEAIEAHAGDVFRCKGFIPVTDGFADFDHSRSGSVVTPVEAPQMQGQRPVLAVIVKGGSAESVGKTLRSVENLQVLA